MAARYVTLSPRLGDMTFHRGPKVRAEAADRVQASCWAVQELAEGDWSRPSDLVKALNDATAQGPVSMEATLRASMQSLAECLAMVRSTQETSGTHRAVMASLARTALISASKVLYVLGPDKEDQRRAHALEVARQDARSLGRLYDDAEKFGQLRGLCPPPEVLEQRRPQIDSFGKQNAIGERSLLIKMSTVAAEMLAAKSGEALGGSGEGLVREHVLWIFHVYSGVAHGLGWPREMPTTDNILPGDWLADVGMVAALGQLAMETARNRWDA